MLLPPMHAPAQIRRLPVAKDGGAESAIAERPIVAEGPLVIMAYGILALDEAEQDQFWIESPAGDLSSQEAREMLRRWSSAPSSEPVDRLVQLPRQRQIARRA